jgi:hypothetical protein
MGRRNPSDLARLVRDKMACRASAWPDDGGRGCFEEADVPFARGKLAGEALSPAPELIIFGGSWRRSSAIEGQGFRQHPQAMVASSFFLCFCPSPYPPVLSKLK